MVESKPPKPTAGAKAKAERLAEALRDNLKRRKAQVRAQAVAPVSEPAPAGQTKKNGENR